MIVDKICEILEKEGYQIDSETNSRIQTMLNSIRDDNQLYKLDYVIEWFNKKREESDMTVKEIGVNEIERWDVDENSGNISHNPKGFFEIIGVKVKQISVITTKTNYHSFLIRIKSFVWNQVKF